MRRTLLLLALIALLPAQARALNVFGELMTSDGVPFNVISDITAILDFEPNLADPFFGLGGGSFDVSSPGLGGADVPPTKNWTHTFAPAGAVSSVVHANVFVLLADSDIAADFYDLWLDGAPWQMGAIDDFDFLGVDFELTGGDVLAQIQNAGDSVDLTLFARELLNGLNSPLGFVPDLENDFDVLASALVVKYEGGEQAIPEPTAAAVFALGALLMTGVARRRAG